MVDSGSGVLKIDWVRMVFDIIKNNVLVMISLVWVNYIVVKFISVIMLI